ncbi:MAG: virulence protein RhuM/Fic/DOC family protein [bacterium]|nr:virulence protein RhuM/Fic/DOC family protein [bacterium]
MKNELVLFKDGEIELQVNVELEKDTVWLTANQMALLFEKDEKTIRKHINNIFNDDELERENNTQKMRVDGVKQKVPFYSLDIIISVGYRVKSKRGIAFRKWANSVLKDYILKGYAVNNNRISQLNEVVRIMKRTNQMLDAKQVLSVVEQYTVALDMLDDYDHQRISKPKGNAATYVLTYEECKDVISKMKFTSDSELFGNEKDDSFAGSIGTIYQTFGGQDVYPSVEEKAANLLYFVTKNHSFSDGNKRIAATMFLYFLDKNGLLMLDENKIIEDYTLVAITIMIAESKPEEKETMVKLVMNFLKA